MDNQTSPEVPKSAFLGSTLAAVVIVVVFYPATLAPYADLTNGGALGLGSLVVASALTWRAFMLNDTHSWLRRLVQLPLAALMTYLTIAEAVVQYRAGHWLWF